VRDLWPRSGPARASLPNTGANTSLKKKRERKRKKGRHERGAPQRTASVKTKPPSSALSPSLAPKKKKRRGKRKRKREGRKKERKEKGERKRERWGTFLVIRADSFLIPLLHRKGREKKKRGGVGKEGGKGAWRGTTGS